MKNSVEFLKDKLDELSKKFKGLKIRYEYVEKTNLHLIETTPYSFYDDHSYLKEEEELEASFEMEYPMERFLFLGEFPLYEINKVTASFEVKPFKTFPLGFMPKTNIIVPTSKDYNSLENYSGIQIGGYALAA